MNPSIKPKVKVQVDPETGRKFARITPLQIEAARLKVLLGTATEQEKKMAAVEYK